jgi:hypothetical protein
MPLLPPPEHNLEAHVLVEASASAVIAHADADAVYCCFRDFFGWGLWAGSDVQFLRVSGAPTEIGARRNVVFGPGKNLHEDLVALDDVNRVMSYCGVNYDKLPEQPLSASPFENDFVDYVSTVRVSPVTVLEEGKSAAFVEWCGRVWTNAPRANPPHRKCEYKGSPAVGLTAELTDFYAGNLKKIAAHFAPDSS